ncbi:hypothetical protein QYE76_065235 [Lolium multiflorum]|uniref:DUF3615 domain-containing protein n=1 Tax=Lolium multiflorum TaxID=4521 RepID=A0AAD8SAI9_LOLMU|nr:hypothetical protein QYE76_065235 [Lolium multiflorum]
MEAWKKAFPEDIMADTEFWAQKKAKRQRYREDHRRRKQFVNDQLYVKCTITDDDLCQDHAAGQTPVSSSSKLMGTLKESSTTTTSSSTPQDLLRGTTEISASSGRCLFSSPGPTILRRGHPDWYLQFYIRIDLSGSFHTYPDVGGPFKSLQEAENAIDCHLHGLQHETMDKSLNLAVYTPPLRKYSILIIAVVQDLAHELKDALHCQIMWEGKRNIWYYHFNFITKTKGADGIDILFFAEVTCIEGDELAVSCCCIINTDANGCCYGCTNNGSVGMKHPNQANAYNAGHPDGYLPFGHSGGWDASDDDVDDFKDEEDRIRHIYKGFDDPDTLRKICTPSPYATATFY